MSTVADLDQPWTCSMLVLAFTPEGLDPKEDTADLVTTFAEEYDAAAWEVALTLNLLLDAWHHDRGLVSTVALSRSLCPLHLVDYAICFDDDDPECNQIRRVFPGHDT